MMRNRRKRVSRASSSLWYLAADRKKTVVAVSLFAIMTLMWIRVLTGKKPHSAGAAPASAGAQGAPTQPNPNVRFVALPTVLGRNDTIDRDFFAARDWEAFRRAARGQTADTGTEVHVVSSDHAQEVAIRIAQKLRLEAVLWSENPQAFVNDELLSVGDKLTAADGSDTCEFEVLRIYEDAVLIGCRGTQLTLRLAQYLDVRK
ncbi:MAG: hypothetical protein JW741_09160 [Sedimentisphaerales bacterium]|nr:hypothetical protein [Sedimentisphaerales bacterium]